MNVRRETLHDVFEIQLEVVPKILAALHPAAAPPPPAEQIPEPEEVAQNIAEIRERVGIESARGALQPLESVAIVSRPFLRIAQHAVRLGGFFELLLGAVVVRIAVRMVLQRKLPVRPLERLIVGLAAHS